MRRSAILSCLAVTVALSAAVSGPSRAVSADAPAVWPEVKLVAPQNDVTLVSRGGVVQMNPGTQVASLGAPLELQVARTRYTKPVEIDQILRTASGGTRERRLPSSLLLNVPHGLPGFIEMTIRDSTGTTLATRSMMFCPDAPDPLRLTSSAPASSSYPPHVRRRPLPPRTKEFTGQTRLFNPRRQAPRPRPAPTGVQPAPIAPKLARSASDSVSDLCSQINVHLPAFSKAF